MPDFEVVIGLEVHVQLKTKSKLFCSCPTDFGALPNTQICPICIGSPGVLPVLNKKAVELLVRAGIATGGRISPHSVFARKQYFYPDLPKNYQISQYELPLSEGGSVSIEAFDLPKRLGLTRIHLEEDAGKLLHAIGQRELSYSLVDLNRTGIPLIEIVSEPDMRSPEEAHAYLTQLKIILQYAGVSDCDMEKGSLRCDANVSLRPRGSEKFGTRAEVKNMNSFKSVKDALDFEIARQRELLSRGERIVQETRLWDQASGQTFPMRSKEEAHDYRYFPDPDLVPVELTEEFIRAVKESMPELPEQRKERFRKEYGLSDYDVSILTSQKALADYFEEAVRAPGRPRRPEFFKGLANWVITELLGRLNSERKDIGECPVPASLMAELAELVQTGAISRKTAQDLFKEIWETGQSPREIVAAKNLAQIVCPDDVLPFVEAALRENPKAVEDVRSGKERALGVLVGAVMKKSGGKTSPALVNELLRKRLLEGK
jgi:aspartyl-tRNA(Asn)/glutamyl-tRNA(Gln) amidotransferase subunit B